MILVFLSACCCPWIHNMCHRHTVMFTECSFIEMMLPVCAESPLINWFLCLVLSQFYPFWWCLGSFQHFMPSFVMPGYPDHSFVFLNVFYYSSWTLISKHPCQPWVPSYLRACRCSWVAHGSTQSPHIFDKQLVVLVAPCWSLLSSGCPKSTLVILNANLISCIYPPFQNGP